jgi:hypothetical protein
MNLLVKGKWDLVDKWKIHTIETAIILIMGSYQIFKFLENLIKLLLFFIDGKILG